MIAPEGRHARVLSGTGGVWQLRMDDGALVDASLRGRLKQRGKDDTEPLKLAVGDDVMIEPGEREDWAIREILPRRSRLVRRAPGTSGAERILAANVDQVVVEFSAAKPDPHLRMLDRFLVIAESNRLPARIVVNKVDLVGETAARDTFGMYERIGYQVHYVSAKFRTGLEKIHGLLDGYTSVFTGPSGVGKSSLMNALFPGLDLRVGEISESVNKGRHTTVGARMVALTSAAGGYMIDTPGLREVGVSDIPGDNLGGCFPEFRTPSESCRFGDCRHTAEPDCGVRGAVASGAITDARYESYRLLLEQIASEPRR